MESILVDVKSHLGQFSSIETNDFQVAVWQERSLAFIQVCKVALWNRTGLKALTWLREDCGLSDDTIQRYLLGYNLADRYEPSYKWGLKEGKVWLPRGVVIPTVIDNVLWSIDIQRSSSNYKNYKIRGSKFALFGADNLRGAWLIMLVGNELDAMLAGQEIGDVVGVATFGNEVWNIDMDTWGCYLMPAQAILVALDSDSAGKKVDALSRLSPQIHPIRIPVLHQGDKNITDYLRSGGDLWEWFKYNLENHGLVPRHKKSDITASLVQNPSIDDVATTTSTNLSVIVNNCLAGPYEPDISRPCFACELLAWRERPPDRGGRWLCGVCHPGQQE